MVAIETGVARALLVPIRDIYERGKERFKFSVERWRNDVTLLELDKRIRSLDKVKTIWSSERPTSLTSFYYPPRVEFSNGVAKVVRSLAELSTDSNIVIEGTAGQGKSIFLRYLALQEVKERGSKRIPVLVELRTVTTTEKLTGAILREFESLGFDINSELFEFYARTGRFVLLLDAFDELEVSLVQETINTLHLYAGKYPGLQIIVTSRPDSGIQSSSSFVTHRLAKLTPQDHEPFLRKLKVDDVQRSAILKAINTRGGAVSGALATPLMMVLLVLVYQNSQLIPEDIPEFYEALFRTLFSRHDKTKPGFRRKTFSGLNERQLQELFEAFSYLVLRDHNRISLDSESFERCFREVSKIVPSVQISSEQFKDDLTRVACVLVEEGGGLVSFSHKTLAEYFAASFVKKSSDQNATLFYEAMKGLRFRVPWRQTLRYLKSIDSYRFAKMFAESQLAAAISMLDEVIKGDESFSAYRQMLVGAEVGIDADMKDVFHITWPDSGTNYYLDEILTKMFDAVFRHLRVAEPDRVKSKCRPIRSGEPNHFGASYSIDVMEYINCMGKDREVGRDFHRVVQAERNRLVQIENELTVLIDVEESKRPIFQMTDSSLNVPN